MRVDGCAQDARVLLLFGVSHLQACQGRLAVTAIETDVDGAGEVGRVCSLAAEGRRAARALSQWCERFALSEPEFQVLWCLRNGMGAGFDQTMLARRLA